MTDLHAPRMQNCLTLVVLAALAAAALILNAASRLAAWAVAAARFSSDTPGVTLRALEPRSPGRPVRCRPDTGSGARAVLRDEYAAGRPPSSLTPSSTCATLLAHPRSTAPAVPAAIALIVAIDLLARLPAGLRPHPSRVTPLSPGARGRQIPPLRLGQRPTPGGVIRSQYPLTASPTISPTYAPVRAPATHSRSIPPLRLGQRPTPGVGGTCSRPRLISFGSFGWRKTSPGGERPKKGEKCQIMQILKKGKIIKPPLDADKKQEIGCNAQVNSTFSDSTALQLLNVEVAKKRAGKSAVCAANYTVGA